MIVDDNPDAVAVMAISLGQAGHETYHAADGQAALAIARKVRPDFIFLDIGLPELNGFEVARELRQDPSFARVRIIAVTGLGKSDDRREALAAGFDQYLLKPIDLTFIRSLLG